MYRVLSSGIVGLTGESLQVLSLKARSGYLLLLQVKSLQAGQSPKCPYCKADFSIYFNGPASAEQKTRYQAEEQQQALAAKRAQQVWSSVLLLVWPVVHVGQPKLSVQNELSCTLHCYRKRNGNVSSKTSGGRLR